VIARVTAPQREGLFRRGVPLGRQPFGPAVRDGRGQARAPHFRPAEKTEDGGLPDKQRRGAQTAKARRYKGAGSLAAYDSRNQDLRAGSLHFGLGAGAGRGAGPGCILARSVGASRRTTWPRRSCLYGLAMQTTAPSECAFE